MFSAASIPSIEMRLIPHAVRAAIIHVNRSLPILNSIVSNEMDVPMPAATIFNRQILTSSRCDEGRSLERPMVAAIPRSGCCDARYDIIDRSPILHPTRHRDVLMIARRHVCRHCQNVLEKTGEEDELDEEVVERRQIEMAALVPNLVGPNCHPCLNLARIITA